MVDNNISSRIPLQDYCPPLDEAVFLVVVSDYDLDQPQQLQACLDTLNSIKSSALDQENSEFDPSGTSGLLDLPHEAVSNQSHSNPGDDSISNSATSITSCASDLNWDSSNQIGADLEEMPQEQKLEWLANTFPGIVPFSIAQILKQCGGSLNQAIDQLLNLSFLIQEVDENGRIASPIPKGVDGFVVDEKSGPPRKGRSTRKTGTTESSRASSATSFASGESTSKANVWKSFMEDVEFISTRTKLQPQSVKSVYHANGAFLPATIRALALKETESLPPLIDTDINVQMQIVDLKQHYQHVPELQLLGALSIARNVQSAARELIEALGRAPEVIATGKVSDFVHYAPVNLEEGSAGHTPSNFSPVRYAGTVTTASSHSLAANTAFHQASAAAKRGRSDRLMGGAAAYYASVGHEHAKLAKEQSAAAADNLVAAQSNSTIVDLHGVSVADAVRITKYKTEHWWHSLGDARYASGGRRPARAVFRIVTGVGRHSRDGAPRIGPAVSKMLVREGWKVEVQPGEVAVIGKARR